MVFIAQLRQTILKIKGKKFNINKVASSYDQISQEYLKYFYKPFQEEYKELCNLLGSVKNKKILDLGCGPGWFGELLLANSLPELYHGIDISTEMIHQARKLLKEFSNTKIEHNDYLQTLQQMPGNSYDIIICTWSLEFTEANTLLNQILRVLKPGGKLVMLLDLKSSCSEIHELIHKLIYDKLSKIDFVLPKKYSPLDSHDLTDLLNKSGFKQTIVWSKSQDFIFDSPSQVYSWARYNGLFAVYDQILDLKDSNSNDFIDLLESTIPEKHVITKKYLGALARK